MMYSRLKGTKIIRQATSYLLYANHNNTKQSGIKHKILKTQRKTNYCLQGEYLESVSLRISNLLSFLFLLLLYFLKWNIFPLHVELQYTYCWRHSKNPFRKRAMSSNCIQYYLFSCRNTLKFSFRWTQGWEGFCQIVDHEIHEWKDQLLIDP